MKLALVKGATSVTVNVFIQNSSSTTGAGLTGLVYNTASLTAYYVRERAAAVAITLATQTVTGAYSSGGFVEIDATNMPGWYRLDIPDAALASGVNSVGLMLKGATNMAMLPIEIQLTDVNLNDGVRAGLTSLPAVASGSAGAIPTTGTGANQINVSGGRADGNVTYFGGAAGTFAAGRPEVNTSHAAGTAWGSGAITAASIAASALNGKGDWNIGKTGYTLVQTFPANFADLAITVTTGRVTVGTNADKTGYSLTATTGLGNQTADITGNLSGSVGSVTGAVGSVTGNVGGNVVGSVASVTARVTANTDQINGIATAAARLGRSTQGIVTGTVGAASTTTSIVTSALDPAAAVIDQYKGRIVTFDQGTTTANLRGQSTDITANTALGVLTVTALTTAPASGDTFTIT